MSADLLDDLLAGYTAPVRLVFAAPTPAKAANSAKSEHPCGLTADSEPANGLRKSANPAQPAAGDTPDSQEFAGVRKAQTGPQSEHPCASSQNSRDSQALGRTCADCRHRLRRGTCARPEAAGLFPPGHGFGIAWPSADHAATCPAFMGNGTLAAPTEPYRLSKAEADAAHAEPWGDAACARFVARVCVFLRRRVNTTDADDLAERLHLRDLQGDERGLCVECRHLAGQAGAWRCGNGGAVDAGRDLPAVLVTQLQRCAGFAEAVAREHTR